jgi:hypothetical protein
MVELLKATRDREKMHCSIAPVPAAHDSHGIEQSSHQFNLLLATFHHIFWIHSKWMTPINTARFHITCNLGNVSPHVFEKSRHYCHIAMAEIFVCFLFSQTCCCDVALLFVIIVSDIHIKGGAAKSKLIVQSFAMWLQCGHNNSLMLFEYQWIFPMNISR